MVFSLLATGALLVLAPLLSITMGLGVQGLIYSTLASNLVGVSIGLYFASQNFGARMDLRAALSILGSSVLSLFAVLPLEVSGFNDLVLLVAEIVVFAAVYLTAAPLLQAIGPEDLDVLASALEGLGRFKSLVLPVLGYERFIMKRFGLLR